MEFFNKALYFFKLMIGAISSYLDAGFFKLTGVYHYLNISSVTIFALCVGIALFLETMLSLKRNKKQALNINGKRAFCMFLISGGGTIGLIFSMLYIFYCKHIQKSL